MINLKDLNDPSYETMLNAVKHDGMQLRYISYDRQTEELCLASVTQCGQSLGYVSNPTNEIYLAAVRQDLNALSFIEDPTPEVCLAGALQDAYAFTYFDLDSLPESEETTKLHELYIWYILSTDNANALSYQLY